MTMTETEIEEAGNDALAAAYIYRRDTEKHMKYASKAPDPDEEKKIRAIEEQWRRTAELSR